ncbi:MAG: hypothetical protein LAN64_07320 [Acidobacteriia bacterium]|nr:hypothetical protein [Terriglobia bacterium]
MADDQDVPNGQQRIEGLTERFYRLVRDKNLLSDEVAQDVAYAMKEVHRSGALFYEQYLPSLLSNPDADPDTLRDRLWDIREEFRRLQAVIEEAVEF